MTTPRDIADRVRRLARHEPTLDADGRPAMERDDDGAWLRRVDVFEAVAPPTKVERGEGR